MWCGSSLTWPCWGRSFRQRPAAIYWRVAFAFKCTGTNVKAIGVKCDEVSVKVWLQVLKNQEPGAEINVHISVFSERFCLKGWSRTLEGDHILFHFQLLKHNREIFFFFLKVDNSCWTVFITDKVYSIQLQCSLILSVHEKVELKEFSMF